MYMKLQEVRHLKIAFWVCAVSLMAVSGLQATPVPPSCALTGTYQDLENYGSTGCLIGDKLFTSFTRGAGTTMGDAFVPTTNQMTYTVINDGSLGPIGFDFNLTTPTETNGMFATAKKGSTPATADFSMSYDVQVFNGPDLLTGAQLCFGPPSPTSSSYPSITQCASPTASATNISAAALVTEQAIAGAHAYNLGVNALGTVNTYSASAAIAPGLPAGQVLTISKNINVLAFYPAGGPNQTAYIKSFAETFTQSVTPIPEPGFYGLLAAGLGGIFLFVKRRQKAL
jgi:hypothetical protein